MCHALHTLHFIAKNEFFQFLKQEEILNRISKLSGTIGRNKKKSLILCRKFGVNVLHFSLIENFRIKNSIFGTLWKLLKMHELSWAISPWSPSRPVSKKTTNYSAPFSVICEFVHRNFNFHWSFYHYVSFTRHRPTPSLKNAMQRHRSRINQTHLKRCTTMLWLRISWSSLSYSHTRR